MSEPTKTDVAAALKRARVMFAQHTDWDMMRALAEATTTEQCGVEGYKVFREARQYVADTIDTKLADFTAKANRAEVLFALDTAFMVAAS